MHYLSLNFMRYIHKNTLSELYFAVVLKSLALSMVGIFVPVYMYTELNFSLNQLSYFFLVWALLFALLTPIVAKIAAKFGLKHMIVASVPFEILFVALLVLMKTHDISYIYAAIVYTFAGAFFWTGFDIEFAKVSDKKKRGSEVGFLFFAITLAGIIGPFFGGLILTFLGFNVLFYVFTFLLIIGAVPLLGSHDDYEEVSFSLVHIFKKEYAKDMLAFSGLGSRAVAAVIFWPLFIFIMLGGYMELGILATGAGLITALFSFYVGKLSDRKGRKKILDIGAIIHSITWAVRLFAYTFFQLFVVELISGLSFVLASIPFNSMFYDKMGKRNKVEYLIFKEIGFTVGKVITLVAVILSGNLIVSFLVAGVASLAYMLYSEK